MVETEAQFLEKVAELAQLLGWKVCHFRTARTKSGWMTPVQFDGKGFVDLIMVRGKRLVFAEVKSDRGSLSLEQINWHNWLKDAGAEVYIWRTSDDWQEIEDILR